MTKLGGTGARALSRRRFLGGAVAAATLTTIAACGGDDSATDSTRPDIEPAEATRSNILLLLLDDARTDILGAMPFTSELARQGVAFQQARSASPVCRPARAGLFSGQYAEHNGVFDNESPLDEVGFDHAETVGSWVQRSGYATMFIGKYGVEPTHRSLTDGWTTLRQVVAADDQAHRDFRVWDGRSEGLVEEWHTDWAVAEILAHVGRAGDDPWFVQWSVNAPHWPFAFAGTGTSDVPFELPAQHGSDWPRWVEALPVITSDAAVRRVKVRQWLEAADVDDRLAELLSALPQAVRSNTVVVVTSDNGLHYGDHRLSGPGTKNTTYDAACRIPLIAAGGGLPAEVRCDVPVNLQDLTATIVGIAGAEAGITPDGGDLRTIVADEAALHDRAVLVQRRAEPGDTFPDADAVCTVDRKLVRHRPGGDVVFELYDLDEDPDELVNVAGDPTRREERDRLEGRLDELLAT